MSENVRSQKWLAISFFLVCILIFASLIYVVLSGARDRTYSSWMGNLRPATETPARQTEIADSNEIVLIKGRQIRLDKVRLTYHGMSSGVLRLDLVLLELDPQYVYRRQIPLDQARQGFQVSNLYFKAVSADSRKLKLSRIKPSN